MNGSSSSAPNVLIILPTYNEALNLTWIVPAILTQVPNVDILIVDDNSPDGTGDIADQMADVDPRVRVLHRQGKEGLGAAYLAGFAWAQEAGYEFVMEMDADGSHRPEHLPAMIEAAANADAVIGSRWTKGGATVDWPWQRKVLSRGGNFYARLMLGVPVNDITGGFRVYRTALLSRMNLDGIHARGYGFQVEMTYRAYRSGARIVEVPIIFPERTYGQSKMSTNIVAEAMKLVTVWGIQRFMGRGPKN